MVDPAQEPVLHLPLLVRFAIVMARFLFPGKKAPDFTLPSVAGDEGRRTPSN